MLSRFFLWWKTLRVNQAVKPRADPLPTMMVTPQVEELLITYSETEDPFFEEVFTLLRNQGKEGMGPAVGKLQELTGMSLTESLNWIIRFTEKETPT